MHHLWETACVLVVVCAILRVGLAARLKHKTTALRGPPNPSFFFGIHKSIKSTSKAEEYEKWAEDYGGVYQVSMPFGGRMIVLCDPKAIAHFYAREPWTYVSMPSVKIATESLIGKGLMTATGESHRRQRRTLTPAFSNAAIRSVASVFYDSAYKAQSAWESLIQSSNGSSTVIEIQSWMNRISLDSIGIAGFSHDFDSLGGKPTTIAEAFDAFGETGHSTNALIFALGITLFPWLLNLPTPHSNLVKRLNDTMGDIARELLTKSRQSDTLGEREAKSILGLLIKAENKSSQNQLTHEEVISHAKFLLLAGYETTSITLTWTLIELCRNQDIQTKLRKELLEFGGDPTYDQLSSSLPYLDAVVHETLRMHPPVEESWRMATEDDAIPLSKPVRTRSGELVNHISVSKGAYLMVSALSLNRSTALWGPDAKEYKPERWIAPNGISAGAKEVQGHRHLLTFIDGPRICLGKGFAIAEIKTVLSVLVKNFVFELVDGPETVIEIAKGVLPRPKVSGEQGNVTPLRVSRFE